MDKTENLFIAVLFFGAGFLFGKNRTKNEKNLPEIPEQPETGGKENPDPMMLRNGFSVTKDKKPTFAEQWVNIMNYSGESQTEGDYEETEGDYSAEDLGRIP